jgi:DNA-binding MarR family transcriptional regulator/GNAT superfamily N-acetyltransferase
MSTTASRVAAVREFNRFYTRRLGMLGSGLLGTPYPLPQARVLYELGQRESTPVQDLKQELDLDAGYLSRLLTSLETQGLITREKARHDARRQDVRLTTEGRAAFEQLDSRSRAEIGELLERLPDADQLRVLQAMHALENAWDGKNQKRAFTLREPRAGELGWVIQRHGALYEHEYGFDRSFEALVARIVADYVDHHVAGRESAWIAELDGEAVGCVFCVRRDEETAQLRLLLVEPKARGFGIGSRLVDECIRFARGAGYTRMVLWTNDVLVSARRIYEARGFELIESEPHHSFGHDLVGQTWQRALA